MWAFRLWVFELLAYWVVGCWAFGCWAVGLSDSWAVIHPHKSLVKFHEYLRVKTYSVLRDRLQAARILMQDIFKQN